MIEQTIRVGEEQIQNIFRLGASAMTDLTPAASGGNSEAIAMGYRPIRSSLLHGVRGGERASESNEDREGIGLW